MNLTPTCNTPLFKWQILFVSFFRPEKTETKRNIGFYNCLIINLLKNVSFSKMTNTIKNYQRI